MLTTLLTAKTGTDGWTHRPLRLAGARIAGLLDLEAATLTRPLHLEDCFLEQPVILNDAQAITIRLTGCHLPGLDGRALHTRGDLRLNGGFTATGEVDLAGAHIGGQLNCSGGTFTNQDGNALVADGLVVDRDMFCGGEFRATGEVRLIGAHIGGQLDCDGGTFTNPKGFAITLARAEIAGEILMRPASLDGGLSLRFAKASAWYDSASATPTQTGSPPMPASSQPSRVQRSLWVTWPRRWLLVRGFSYNDIDSYPPITVRRRLEWLRRDTEGFIPQPYEQLAAVYRRDGNEHAARKVLISAQWHRRGTTGEGWVNRLLWLPRVVWSALLWATIGYGYRPWLILLPIGLLFGFGVRRFADAEHAGEIIPARDLSPSVHFNSAIYTADLLLPGASLG